MNKSDQPWNEPNLLRHITAANNIAEPWAQRYVQAAFRGDINACDSLAALGNQNRGVFAELMWLAKVEQDAYRAFLASAWVHDHRQVVKAAGSRRRLADMFRYAQFEIPAVINDCVRVWRGTSALPLTQARAGICWTTNRDVACWFAMRSAKYLGMPLVLTATVSRRDVSFYSGEREENEVVLLKAPFSVVDGDEHNWQIRYEFLESSKTARQQYRISAAMGAASLELVDARE